MRRRPAAAGGHHHRGGVIQRAPPRRRRLLQPDGAQVTAENHANHRTAHTRGFHFKVVSRLASFYFGNFPFKSPAVVILIVHAIWFNLFYVIIFAPSTCFASLRYSFIFSAFVTKRSSSTTMNEMKIKRTRTSVSGRFDARKCRRASAF